MQSIYAMHQSSSDNLEREEKFLLHSLDNVQDLYLVMISTLLEIKKMEEFFLDVSSKKHLATPQERNPNKKFINNQVLQMLSENNSIGIALENRNINDWELHDDYIKILLQEIKQSDMYAKYMSNAENTFEEDKQFVVDIFEQLIVPNEKLYEYLEDNKLTWIDDIPLVNTQILKQLKGIKAKDDVDTFKVAKLYKDTEDKEFVLNLFRKTVLNESCIPCNT